MNIHISQAAQQQQNLNHWPILASAPFRTFFYGNKTAKLNGFENIVENRAFTHYEQMLLFKNVFNIHVLQ